MRHLLITATAALFFVGVVAVEAAQGAELRDEAVVHGPMLTLGDLFFDISSDQAALEIAPAPAFGHGIILDRPWLERVARAHSLAWLPQRGDVSIEVRRPTEEELSALADSLSDDLAAHMASAAPAMESAVPVAPEPSAPDAVATGAPERDPVLEVPAMVRMLRPGDTISINDVMWIEIPENRRAYDYVHDVDEMLGMAARRTLPPDQPVRYADLTLPLIVEKGEAVTMTIRHGPMTITARGRALDDGAMNDVIRVLNVDSNRTIDATVSGTATVSVRLSPALAFAQ